MIQLKLLTKARNTFLFVSFVILSLGCSKIRIENYYIPKGFTGNVAVIYNENKSFNEDTYNYNIPENGILTTKCNFKSGKFKINFLQNNSLDRYDTLYEELPGKKIDTFKNRIYFNRVLTFKNRNDKEVFVSTFYVGKVAGVDLEKDRFLFERKLEKMILNR